ncbi:MAG TPA: hypothetical protein VMU27_00285, partial [Candidatus Paceibacterota bacterium]|nr:hypothetical protein [Candidatus Paceibacterota bacterium]
MNQSDLGEYRCSCGKLLFKGTLSAGVVEVKCRRCGSTKQFEQFDANAFLVVDSDTSGRVEDVFST